MAICVGVVCIVPMSYAIDLVWSGEVLVLIWLGVDHCLIVVVIWLFRILFILLYLHISFLTLTNAVIVSSWLRSSSTSWIFVININALAFGIRLMDLLDELLVSVMVLSQCLFFGIVCLIPCSAEAELWLCRICTIHNVLYVAEWSWPELWLNGFIVVLTMWLFVIIWWALLR